MNPHALVMVMGSTLGEALVRGSVRTLRKPVGDTLEAQHLPDTERKYWATSADSASTR